MKKLILFFILWSIVQTATAQPNTKSETKNALRSQVWKLYELTPTNNYTIFLNPASLSKIEEVINTFPNEDSLVYASHFLKVLPFNSFSFTSVSS